MVLARLLVSDVYVNVYRIFSKRHQHPAGLALYPSGRFVKQEQWNAGESSGNWCMGLSTGGASALQRSGGITHGKFLRLCMQNLAIWCMFWAAK